MAAIVDLMSIFNEGLTIVLNIGFMNGPQGGEAWPSWPILYIIVTPLNASNKVTNINTNI